MCKVLSPKKSNPFIAVSHATSFQMQLLCVYVCCKFKQLQIRVKE